MQSIFVELIDVSKRPPLQNTTGDRMRCVNVSDAMNCTCQVSAAMRLVSCVLLDAPDDLQLEHCMQRHMTSDKGDVRQ
jgi:hypothetical protein